MQENVLSLGSQIIGVTHNKETALKLAEHFSEYDPDLVKRRRPQWRSNRGFDYIVDYDVQTYGINEQWELAARQFRHLPPFTFLAAIATREGEPALSLRRLTIERFAQGRFPEADEIRTVRAELMAERGQAQDQILAEIAARQPGHGPARSPHGTPDPECSSPQVPRRRRTEPLPLGEGATGPTHGRSK
jgi:hypothetical protein